MTPREIRDGMGRHTLKADLHRLQMLRFAEMAYRRHGTEILKRCDDCNELGDDGRLRAVADPTLDLAIETAGAEAAGFVLTERYLAKGCPAADVPRQVLGRARKLARAWPGREFDRAKRIEAYRRGMRKALARVG